MSIETAARTSVGTLRRVLLDRPETLDLAAARDEVPADWLVGGMAIDELPFSSGGDVLVIGDGAVLVGMGERTRPGAGELLAERLFAAGAAERVIAVAMPRRRSAMHLDTALREDDLSAAIAGAELGRGHGGPRCMSCPTEREELS